MALIRGLETMNRSRNMGTAKEVVTETEGELQEDSVMTTQPSESVGISANFLGKGRLKCTVPIPPSVGDHSHYVATTITEVDPGGSPVPILGEAYLQVFNVVPSEDRITVRCHVDSYEPVLFQLNCIVVV